MKSEERAQIFGYNLWKWMATRSLGLNIHVLPDYNWMVGQRSRLSIELEYEKQPTVIGKRWFCCHFRAATIQWQLLAEISVLLFSQFADWQTYLCAHYCRCVIRNVTVNRAIVVECPGFLELWINWTIRDILHLLVMNNL